MTGVFAFASAGPAALARLGRCGRRRLRNLLAFTFGGAGLGVNGAGVNSTGSLAAVLLGSRPGEVHPSNIACGELRQLHPAEHYTDKLPMRSILMHVSPQLQSSVRISCGGHGC